MLCNPRFYLVHVLWSCHHLRFLRRGAGSFTINPRISARATTVQFIYSFVLKQHIFLSRLDEKGEPLEIFSGGKNRMKEDIELKKKISVFFSGLFFFVSLLMHYEIKSNIQKVTHFWFNEIFLYIFFARKLGLFNKICCPTTYGLLIKIHWRTFRRKWLTGHRAPVNERMIRTLCFIPLIPRELRFKCSNCKRHPTQLISVPNFLSKH